jgi:gamma-D-glutamyl-L-lysine dipeptidyl-peptidase
MAQFGFCDLAVIPLRRDPSDKAELSTQLFFGDLLEILEQSGSWLQIRNCFDDYIGWVDFKQIKQIPEEEFLRLKDLPLFVNGNLNGDVVRKDDTKIMIPAGCSFYGIIDHVFRAGEEEYKLEGKYSPFSFSGMDDLITTAMGYLNCPYLWGGKTFMGIDCSGLTQVVYKQHGVRLLRDAAQQASQGEMINFLSDGLPGDLVFFDNAEGTIVHVGLLLDNQRILHCSGKVRIDTIDHQGIFNRDLNRYTHRLRVIKRVVSR